MASENPFDANDFISVHKVGEKLRVIDRANLLR